MNKDFTCGPGVSMVPLAVLCIMGCFNFDPPDVELSPPPNRAPVPPDVELSPPPNRAPVPPDVELSPPPNRAPVPSGSLAAQTLAVGQAVAVDVSPYFGDPDGDSLVYTAASSDRDLATATMGGSELRVTGLARGPVRVTVRATDPGQLSTWLNFEVTVLPSVLTAQPAQPAQPASMAGRTIKDCDVCPTMIVVPTGNFVMGAPPGEQGRDESEGPDHVVEILDEFAVGVYEVTFAEWGACVNAGRCGGLVPQGGGPGMGGHPVINVSWQDVEGYLEWLTERTGYQYRLPTEAEWEYVARGGTQTPRYWGPTAAEQCRYANGADGEAPCPDGHPGAAPVGVLLPNGFGLHDVLGNVWEWTQDCWNDRLSNSQRADAVQSGNCARRVVRGGSAFDGPTAIRAASRGNYPAAARVARVGFRVARALN